MNKPLIITIGIVILLLVLGVWVYLMLFGTPEDKGEVFTNLGFDLGQQSTTVNPPLNTQPLDTLVDTQSSEKLQQLTTRPVAGYTFASTTSNEQTIRYIEKGTGHMFEINLTTGQEEIITATTIPQVVEAVFSPLKQTVALISYDGYSTRVFIGTISNNQSLVGIDLEPGATNISFTNDGTLLYTVSKNGVTKGYTHNLTTQTKTEQFSFNYTNIDMGWGFGLSQTYLATKPAYNLKSYIYSIQNNIITPIIQPYYGLSAFYNTKYIIGTYTEKGIYQSSAFTSTNTIRLPLLTLKEKCTFDTFSVDHLWCASPIDIQNKTYVEDWYKGSVSSPDYLWLISIVDGSAQLYGDLQELSGRILDVQHVYINSTGDTIAFINKIDQTLWIYNLKQE